MTAPLVLGCGVLGLAVGSFLNVVAHRVPRHQSLVRPGSRCPYCAAPVRPFDNLPVASWLILDGRCRTCRTPIPVRYPAVELVTATLFSAIALRFGMSPELPAFLVGFASLLALTVMAMEHDVLPRSVVWSTLVATGVLLTLAAGVQPRWHRLGDALAGAAGAWALVGLGRSAWSRRVAGSDVCLAPLTGALLGFLSLSHVLVSLGMAAVLAGLFSSTSPTENRRGRYVRIPLAPILVVMAVATTLLGDSVLTIG